MEAQILQNIKRKRSSCDESDSEIIDVISRKKNFGTYAKEKNVYMMDRRKELRQMLGDYSSDDECSSSSTESSSEEEGPKVAGSVRKRRKSRSRKRRLQWSKSPEDEAKYSDWKIDVRYFPAETRPSKETEETGQEESPTDNDDTLSENVPKATEVVTYSVHRSTLGIQSEYFERIFLGGYSESIRKKNTIVLPVPLVTLAHFECVLEFCYLETANLNTDNVVSIIYLSDYLGIEELRNQAQAYVRKGIHEVNSYKGRRVPGSSKKELSPDWSKLKSSKVSTYYNAAKILGMEDLQQAIVHVCSKEPDLFTKDFALTDMPDLDFWKRLWEARKTHPDQRSLSKRCVRFWSANLAYFLAKHPGIADLETFRKLTDVISLPFISTEVAILLMEQEHILYLDAVKANVYLVNKEGDQAESLTCLQSRCIAALYNIKAGGWQISNSSDAIRGRLRKLPAIVLESILLKTVEYERAGQQYPMPIVSGAGSDCVNGVYKMAGWFKNALKFTKWGIYEGNSQEFTLYRYEGEWWISIIPEDHDEPGDCDDIDFYSYDKLEEDTIEWPLPPAMGWTICSGELPAPSVRLLTPSDHERESIENP
mmetsp:Transcript_13817/g.32241  ORF Transcript_13817/g.32241 Transcript_13817/m.32241 type:complete len:595 (+) Transcript_13817:103-1887(+)